MERLSPIGRGGESEARESSARGGVTAEDPSELAPRGVGQLLDAATDAIKRRFPPCVGLAFLFWLPGQWLVRGLYPDQNVPSDILLVTAGINLITVAESMLISAAVAVITYGTIEGRRVPIGEVLRRLLTRIPLVVAATAITLALVVPGVLMCILPGLYLVWRFLFAPTIVVLERAGPVEALRRSWALTRQGLPRWLAAALVTYFYLAPFTVGAELYDESFLQSLVPVASPALVSAVSLGFKAFLLAVYSAFYGVLVTVLYVDARVRIEAFDLDLRLERLAASRLPVASSPVRQPQGGLA